MQLSFSTTFPAKVPGIGKRVTDFAAKIYACGAAHLHKPKHFLEDGWKWNLAFAEKIPPKRHTIREDAKGRWKEGNLIHFCQGGYIKGRVFAEGVCTGVQTIAIDSPHGESVHIFDWRVHDWRQLDHAQVETLAVNDGFRSSQEFYAYFRHATGGTGFRGKIIHWTDTRY